MSNENAFNTILAVADRLDEKKHPHAAELRRLAQSFDPRMMMGDNQTQEFAGGGSMQIMDDSAGTNLAGGMGVGQGHPMIEQYVKQKQGDGGQIVDDRKTHTCTVTFKSPHDVTEAEMMNYILGIGKELGVDVDSFKWSKSEPKPGQTGGAPR